jgi:hypothetical protein
MKRLFTPWFYVLFASILILSEIQSTAQSGPSPRYSIGLTYDEARNGASTSFWQWSGNHWSEL